MKTPVSILIIDDEKDFCKLLVSILKNERYLLECAYTIGDAYVKLSDRYFQIILLDNNLPDGKGIELLQDCNYLFTRSRVIMMSADDSGNLRRDALHLGAYEFLIKPFSLTKLQEVISSVSEIA